MKIAYEVHYNKGDALDYRSYMHYTLYCANFEDAQKAMSSLMDQGIDSVLQIKPYFDEFYK